MNLKLILTLSCLLALAACGDDSKSEPAVTGSDASTIPSSPVETDAGVPTMPNPDGGAPIPLLTWVDDLVDHHTSDDSVPDTVDDKNIIDDENPTAYDSRFQ